MPLFLYCSSNIILGPLGFLMWLSALLFCFLLALDLGLEIYHQYTLLMMSSLTFHIFFNPKHREIFFNIFMYFPSQVIPLELYRQEARSAGMSLAQSINAISNLTLSLTFLHIEVRVRFIFYYLAHLVGAKKNFNNTL